MQNPASEAIYSMSGENAVTIDRTQWSLQDGTALDHKEFHWKDNTRKRSFYIRRGLCDKAKSRKPVDV